MHLSDEQLLELLLSEKKGPVNEGLRHIYQEYFPLIRSLVTSNSGSAENAADVFQEAIIVLMRQLRNGRFERKSSLRGFLYGISRNIWLKELRKKSLKTVSLTEVSDQLLIESDGYDSTVFADRKHKIGAFVSRLDENCRALLRAFYYQRHSVKEIMRIFDIESESAVKNRKYRCMKKLIGLVNKENLSRSSFEGQ